MASNMFEGRTVLVTGGAGSIGSSIVKELIKLGPAAVRVFDNSESALFNMQSETNGNPIVRFLVGDVRSKDRLKRAMEGVDIVFHAAALKHVPMCEYNSFEAVETNVIGTQNVIDAAMNENVEKVISISTDKAVNPISTMGATKLLSEKLITSANHYKGKRRTVLSSVRFGNVLASSGSVITIFQKCIKEGSPVPITDAAMTRFFMSMRQAVDLIFKATEMAQGGEVFIFKMPSMKIVDLANAMAEELKPKGGFRTSEIGVRPGEKLHEELVSKDEVDSVIETDDMYIIMSRMKEKKRGQLPEIPADWKNARHTASAMTEYSSKDNNITKERIVELLKREGVL